MRPEILNPLFADVTTVKGIGDKLTVLLAKLLRGQEAMPARLVDGLFHLPSYTVDRSYFCTIAQLPLKGIVTLEVTIGEHQAPPRGSRKPYRITVYDDTGHMSLVLFSTYADHMARNFPIGEKRIISGEIAWFKEQAQMTHPDYVVRLTEADKIPKIEPVYPLNAGLTSKVMSRVAKAALEKLPTLPEWQDAAWLEKNKWLDFKTALQSEHVPTVASPNLNTPNPIRARLAYDELLANQLALHLTRQKMKRATGRVLVDNGLLRDQVLAELPYQLTNAQTKAGAEIKSDMAAPERMIRLLQGDVGAGKTIVALLALVTAVEAGTQGALMAPTEILARQHFAGLSKIVANTTLRLALLTGREKGRVREDLLEKLSKGEIDILIGTHALFQDEVAFHDLGLAVIDEQHRFGVHQRLALQAKAHQAVDLLVMTATPIPRTLALTAYGDMDVSKLNEKPPGRLPIDTRVMSEARIDDVIAGIARSMAQGTRAYWVCPLVEESELVDLTNATARFESLVQMFPSQVGLVHGRMKAAEKDETMAAFKEGRLSILVATTVIEVGVDVPEAAIMVIENAERFGLAQLHQLRGRVGRGKAKSSCILLYQDPLGEVAKQRLSTMRETEDGFLIAEEDLRLRGAGEILGTAQSGLALFKMADLTVHGELLAAARDDVRLILSRDPTLNSPRGQALRHLLYIFEREAAIKLLSSG